MSTFSNKVKELMIRDNISQKELSALSKISESSISRYLSDSLEPRLDVITNIAKVFNVPISYLMEEGDGLKIVNAFDETLCVVTRNKEKLTDQQKAELIKILFGNK